MGNVRKKVNIFAYVTVTVLKHKQTINSQQACILE